jgi:hypothetical protein
VLYTISRGTSIRTIPLSLAAVLAVCFGGPLGVRNLSVNSQADRLTRLLSGNDQVPERAREASAALGFLLQYDARDAVKRIFGDSTLANVELEKSSWAVRDSVATRLLALKGIEYSASSARSPDSRESARLARGEAVPVGGYDWMLPLDFMSDTISAHAGSHAIQLTRDSTRTWLQVQVDSTTPVRFRVDSMYRGWLAADSASRARQLMSERSAGSVRLLLALNEIFVFIQNDSLRIGGAQGHLLVGEPR